MSGRALRFRVWDGREYHYAPEGLRAVAEFYEPWVLTLDGLTFRNNGQGRFLHDIDLTMRQKSVVEQWTGLKDRNGRDIYESDIIAYDLSLPPPRRALVRWERARWTCPDDPSGECDLSDHPQSDLEVIGNIHQNAHLLALESANPSPPST